MKMRRDTFLIIALLYFISKLLYFFLVGKAENTVVTPGWHTTIEYKLIYNDWFTAVYFLAIAAIYHFSGKETSTILFWSHVAVSIIPLASLIISPMYFNKQHYNVEDVWAEFRMMGITELFFIISQAVIIIFLLTKNRATDSQHTT